ITRVSRARQKGQRTCSSECAPGGPQPSALAAANEIDQFRTTAHVTPIIIRIHRTGRLRAGSFLRAIARLSGGLAVRVLRLRLSTLLIPLLLLRLSRLAVWILLPVGIRLLPIWIRLLPVTTLRLL